MSGLETGWGKTRIPVSSAGGPALLVPNLAIETARLQAPVGTPKRSVVTGTLEEDAAVGALGAVMTEGVVISDRHGAVRYLTGGS